MSATVTVTGKIGPGNTLTAAVYTGVTYFAIDTESSVLTLLTDRFIYITITAATTITVTKSGTTYTVAIS